jgi:hypothetical protein
MRFHTRENAERPDRSARRGWPQLRWWVGGIVAASGLVLLVAGWLTRTNNYWSGLLVQFGSAFVLVLPLLAVERFITRRIDTLQTQLEALRRETSDIAGEYEELRDTLPPGKERTNRMRDVFNRAQTRARGRRDREVVAELFHRGDVGDRMTALGLMAGNHRLLDADCVALAIRESRSGYEQWKGLILTQNASAALTSAQLDRILDAVKEELEDPYGRIHEAAHRVDKARELLTSVRRL